MVTSLLYSVIIPVYNNSKTIRRPLDSLKVQSFKGFEVIIVDDCSDDFEDLEHVVDDYKDNLKIKVVRHQVNKNGAAARNTGVLYATAPYVAFLDSDDSWRNDKLSSVNKLIQAKSIDDQTLIYSMVNLYKGKKFMRVEPSRGINCNESVSDYFFCYGQLMQTSTFVCARVLAMEVGFDERFTRHQDSSFVMEAQKKGCTFKFINDPLVNYMFPESGLKKRISQKRISVAYCDYWLNEMSDHFSSAALQGYNFYVKSRVLMESGRPFSGCFLWFVSWVQFTPAMHLSLVKLLWKRYVGKRQPSPSC